MTVEQFLKFKGLDPKNMVIYNMLNTSNPRIPLDEWLKEFETLVIQNKLRDGLEVVPAQSHKLNDVGSSPTPATSQ